MQQTQLPLSSMPTRQVLPLRIIVYLLLTMRNIRVRKLFLLNKSRNASNMHVIGVTATHHELNVGLMRYSRLPGERLF